MSEYGLKQLVDELVSLSDENLARRVAESSDVRWCLSELQDILAADVVPVKHGTREKTNLIDAAALGKKLEAFIQKYAAAGKLNVAQDYNFVLTVIEGAPTVDAVEVVRCKDCKNFDPDSSVCKYSGWLMNGSDFCSRGIDKDFLDGGDDDATDHV